jgi:cell division septal protein FtsQ
VRDATFRRALPSTLEIVVSEREPVGIGRAKGKLYVIDERGAVIADYGPQYADLDLPIIDGLSASPGRDGTGDEGRAALAARVIASLRAKPALARRLSQFDVADAHNAAVIVDGDRAVIYVGEDRFLPRLESYLGLAAALRERVADIDYVDLRFDDRIYVRPSSLTRKKVAGPAARAATAVPASALITEPEARRDKSARTRR